MASFWGFFAGRKDEERKARAQVTVARAALKARQRDLESRIGERDANMAQTLQDMLPGSRNDDVS